MTISFYGTETTGGVADRKIETAKNETTGSVGIRQNQDSIFTVDDDLKQDTVSFRANAQPKKKTSTFTKVIVTTAGIATLAGLAGLAHKYDAVGKYIKNEKAQKFFRHTDVVTEPCHKACSWVKQNCYDKVIKFFSSKK